MFRWLFPQRKIKHATCGKWIDHRRYLTAELHFGVENAVLIYVITCHHLINAFGQLVAAVH